MRAIFQKDLIVADQYQIKGEAAHHLINVVRVRLNEDILLLDGKGLKIKTRVLSLLKKEVVLTQVEQMVADRNYLIDLALGVPKKDALELSLKQAVELGFRKIFLIRSQYSQTKVPDSERIDSLLISALEQSNSGYLPEIIQIGWEEIPTSDYSEILMMDSQNPSKNKRSSKKNEAKLLIVGPEGGFSPSELELLHQIPNIQILNLPTPLLRTPTAVAAGAGIIIGSLLD